MKKIEVYENNVNNYKFYSYIIKNKNKKVYNVSYGSILVGNIKFYPYIKFCEKLEIELPTDKNSWKIYLRLNYLRILYF